MSRSRRLFVVWCSALLLGLTCGCHLFCRDRPISVLATDAETGKPLPDADVTLAYCHSGAPAGRSAKTGADGVARLQASPDEMGVQVAVSAPNHLSEEKYLPAAQLEAIHPVPLLFGAEPSGPPTLVLALYAEPRPSVELVVPDGFRGAVKVEVDAQQDAPLPLGQRVFTAVVPSSGEVRVSGPALLGRINTPDFTARYAGGTPLPRAVKDGSVGLWWLKSEGSKHTFFVGTKAEYDAFRPSVSDDSGSSKGKSSGGGRGRRGGGGRRGGMGQGT